MWDIDHHLIKGLERITLHNSDLESIVAVNIYVWTRNDEDVCKKLFAKLIDMWCSVQLMGFIASRKKCTLNVMGGAFSSVYQLWQISVKCFILPVLKWKVPILVRSWFRRPIIWLFILLWTLGLLIDYWHLLALIFSTWQFCQVLTYFSPNCNFFRKRTHILFTMLLSFMFMLVFHYSAPKSNSCVPCN